MPFSQFTIERNTCGPDDITIDIKYCGICHTDVHYVMDDFYQTPPRPIPLVPGHEIAGVVTQASKRNSIGPLAAGITQPCLRVF